MKSDMSPEQFLTMTKNLVNGTSMNGSNQWQDYLLQYQSGGGPYWVPDPAFGATKAQLLANRNKAQLFVEEFDNLFTYIFKSEYTNPMHYLQNQLKQKVYNYDLAIAALESQTLPESSTPPPIPETETPETPEEGTGISNTTLLLVGAGVVGLYLYTRKKRSGRKVTGVKSIVPVAAAGLALYLILKPKGQETQTPGEPITATPGIVPQQQNQ